MKSYMPVQYFKALADETRLRLLNILYNFELNVNELVNTLDMGQSRISRHLKILSSAGLLNWRRDGLWVFYSVPEEGQHRNFIEAAISFIAEEELFIEDLKMAQLVMDERTRKTKVFFDSIAEDWDRLSDEVLGDFNLPAKIKKLMPKCETSCDLGCGTGNVLAAMLDKSSTVIGVDGSARMLEVAKRHFDDKGKRVSLRIGDLSHLPLRDEEADFASLNLVLHHIPSPIEILKEVYRVLKPKGELAIADFVQHKDEAMRKDYGDHWLGFSYDDLEKFLDRSGFKVKSHETKKVGRELSLHILIAERL